jgi:hypothetical protein
MSELGHLDDEMAAALDRVVADMQLDFPRETGRRGSAQGLADRCRLSS